MIGEFERPGRRRAAQDRALARYLRTAVAPYSARYRDELRRRPITSVAALTDLPTTRVADETDPGALVLRPTAQTIASSPDRKLHARLWWARMTHRLTAFNRSDIEPSYKPIHWHLARSEGRSVPIGYSADDLDRLGAIGRTMLEMAGVGERDVLVSVQPPAPTPAFWQVALGARDAGVSSLFVDPGEAPDVIAAMGPNVLAGHAVDLLAILEEGRADGLSFAGLHTLLVLGEPVDPVTRTRLSQLAGASEPAAVVAVWGPPGVRAAWSECRNGTDVHTWPAYEVLEMVEPEAGTAVPAGTDGEVVYTPLGWHGTVMLRLRTGVLGCLDDTACVSCGRTSPRVRVVPGMPPFARILDEHPDVDLWQAELRHVDGSEELIVFITPRRSGHPGRLLRELDRQLSVTQFVVLDRAALAERLRAHGDARVLDQRR